MKILILTSSFPYSPGDHHSNFIFHHAKGQVDQGHEVHVICPHIPGAAFSENMQGVNMHRFGYFYPYRYERLASDTGMYPAIRHSPLAMIQLPLFVFFQFCLGWRIIRRYRIDLINTHWMIPSGFVGAALKVIWKKPHIITSHVLDANLFGKFRITLPLLSAIVASADVITTNSTYTKHQIENLVQLPCPCMVIPMGIYVPAESPAVMARKHENTILYVGRLIEWKGVDTLIRAMPPVIKQIPGARLFIVGEGPYRDSLESLVRENSLTEVVRFLGRVSDDDLRNLYDSATVFVLPSRRHQGLVMEGLGVVLLEAMSHGVPVIGSNIGGIPDIITDGENGYLFSTDNPEDLAPKIIRLIGEEKLISQFRLKGYETVKTRFAWEEISKKFSDIYRLMNRKKISGGTS
jgi:glycosyltransferase involved in cell wall biosynthesis